MDYVFIDTSIFEANNFLESKRINEILRLAEEKNISIILPAVTYNEVRNRAIKNIKEATAKFRSYRDSTRILRNITSLSSKFEKFEEEECIKEFSYILESRFSKANVKIIDYPTLNIKEVFDKYFSEEFPFSKGEKKSEFPDAFALLSVEHWCKTHKKKCFVFSHDKDLLSYKSDYLIILESYESYLDNLLRQLEIDKQRQGRIERINEVYKSQKSKLEIQVAKWLYNSLNKPNMYQKFSDTIVNDIIINSTDAKLKTLQIISTTDSEVIVETKAEVYYHVEVEIEDEDALFNDRNWLGSDNVYVLYENKKIINVQLKITNPIDNPESVWIEIDQINNGKQFKL